MSITSERFSEELDAYKKNHNNISVEKIVDLLSPQKKYYRERFSKFRNGTVKLDEQDLDIFSNLFHIRKEYLAGIDNYRTIDDYDKAKQREKGLFAGLHQILVALGYADTYMDASDYNNTFPSNTRALLELLKNDLNKNKVSLICDVNADTYVSISTDYYEQLLNDVIDYLSFKLEKLFTNSSPLPTVVSDNSTTLLHPTTDIQLKDNTSITCNIKYVPNSEYDSSSLQQAISITKHKPSSQ